MRCMVEHMQMVVAMNWTILFCGSTSRARRSTRFSSVPTSQRVRTFSPFVAFSLPGHARLGLQWEIVDDYLARDVRGVPSDLPNNQWTLRLQGTF